MSYTPEQQTNIVFSTLDVVKDFIVKVYHKYGNYKYNVELTRDLIIDYYKKKYGFEINGYFVDEIVNDKDLKHRVNRTPEQSQIIYGNVHNMIDYVANRYSRNNFYRYQENITKQFIITYYKQKFDIKILDYELEDILNQNITVIQERVNKSREQIREIKYNNYINYVRSVITKKAENKTHITFDKLFASISVSKKDAQIITFPLTNEDKRKLYDEYNELYYNNHPKIIKPKLDTFERRIVEYVNTHNKDDELLEFEDFKRLTDKWDVKRTKSTQDYYGYYNKKYYQYSPQIQTTITPYNNIVGYKSKKKYEVLHNLNTDLKPIDNTTPSSFPLKSNIKKYQLHKVAARNTYMIDLMFSGKLCYLVAINVNTKYLIVELMNAIKSEDEFTTKFSKKSKDVNSYLRTLQRIIDNGIRIKHLIGDGEKAFMSKTARDKFYTPNGIDFIAVPRQYKTLFPDFIDNKFANKTDPLHSALGIIDRVIRTIRDMAYNMKIDPNKITPNIMNEIVNQYNNSPHNGLSKYAGFDVSPVIVQNDNELEEYIVRKICQCNYEIVNQPGYRLHDGMNVKIYNEKDTMSKRREIIQPGEFRIDKFENGLYTVKNIKNNKTQLIPRYRLALCS